MPKCNKHITALAVSICLAISQLVPTAPAEVHSGPATPSDTHELDADADSDAEIEAEADADAEAEAEADAEADADAEAGADAGAGIDGDGDGVPDYRDVCLSDKAVAVDPLGCAVAGPLILEGVRFDVGQSHLDRRARKSLDQLAAALEHIGQPPVEVASHTDSAGSTERNRTLSGLRADAVRHYLILRGIAPPRLRAIGHGEAYPLADNATREGRRRNRRLEIIRLDEPDPPLAEQ